jgi:hypothetical protein
VQASTALRARGGVCLAVGVVGVVAAVVAVVAAVIATSRELRRGRRLIVVMRIGKKVREQMICSATTHQAMVS